MSDDQDIVPLIYLSKNKSCLIVGAGKVAARRIEKFLNTSLEITVIAPQIHDKISSHKSINLIQRKFKDSDLDGKELVIAATNDSELNLRIVKLCQQNKILVSSVDEHWTEGDFISPASFQVDNFTIAISSSGKDYRATKSLRKDLETYLNSKGKSKLLFVQRDLAVLSECDKSLISKGIILKHIKGIHEFSLLGGDPSPGFVGLVDPSTDLLDVLSHCLYDGDDKNILFYWEDEATKLLSKNKALLADALNKSDDLSWSGQELNKKLSGVLNV